MFDSPTSREPWQIGQAWVPLRVRYVHPCETTGPSWPLSLARHGICHYSDEQGHHDLWVWQDTAFSITMMNNIPGRFSLLVIFITFLIRNVKHKIFFSSQGSYFFGFVLVSTIFKSLLYEACGRMVNPIFGLVGFTLFLELETFPGSSRKRSERLPYSSDISGIF